VDFGWEIASTHWSSAASRPGITGCTPEHVEPARASAAMPPAAPSPPRTPAPRVMPEGAVRRGSRPARHHHPGPAAPALAGGVRTRRQ
jgi:hypothetical protein